MKKLFTFILSCALASPAFSQVPANDDCANAVTLSVGTSCVFSDFTNLNATPQLPGTGYPSPGCAGVDYNEVWFKFIAPAGGAVIIDSDVNSMLDGAAALYSGTCGNFTLIDCDDDSSPNGNMAYINASGLTPGAEYFIAFWEYAADNDGTFKICLKIPPVAPANDECTSAISLIVNPDMSCSNSAAATIESATASSEGLGTCFGTADDDVWFSFIATGTTHSVGFNNATGTTDDLILSVYGGNCGALNQLGCDEFYGSGFSIFTGLTQGQTYFVRIFSWSDTPEITTFNICVGTPPPAPSNDECASAISLIVNPDFSCANITSATLESATASSEGLGTCFGTADDDVWFSFVATTTTHSVGFSNAVGSTDDLMLSVYSGTCGTLNQLSCDEFYGNGNSILTNLAIGETYFVRVFSWTANPTNTTFDMCIGVPPPAPSNDECASALAFPTILTDGSCSNLINQSTISATLSTVDATGACTGNSGDEGDDVWFSFVAPATTLILSSTNVDGLTDIYWQVFSDACGASMNSILCTDNDGGGTLSGLTIGATYLIRLYTWSTEGYTTQDICLQTPPPAPSNDECVAATSITASTTNVCTSETSAYLTSSTTSTQTNDCFGTADDDVWFSFVATNVNQTVTLSNAVGSTTDLYHSVYAGTCSTFGTALVCNDSDISQLTGLTVGETYFVRVFTYTSTTGQNVTFDICITNPDVVAPEIFEGTTTNPTTCAGTNGSIEILGTGTGNLSWTGTSSGNQTNVTLPVTLSNFTAGTYNFIFNNGVASNTITTTLTDPALPAVTLTSFNAICNTAASFALTGGLPTGGFYTVNGNVFTTFNPAIATIGANNIVYIFTDANSCAGSATQSITVNNCAGIESNTKSLFSIYPNPTNSKIVIEGDKLVEISSIELRDELGRLVQNIKGNTNSISIDLSNYSNGIYTLVLKGTDFTEIKKVQFLK